MNNTDLVHKEVISWASVTQMSKNENANTFVIRHLKNRTFSIHICLSHSLLPS